MLRLALLALLLLASTSADGQQGVPAWCYSATSIAQAAAQVASDEGTKPIDITGPAAQRYLDVLNAEPPTTALKASHVLLVPRKVGGPTLSVFIEGMPIGCVIGRVAPKLHIRALQASKETPA